MAEMILTDTAETATFLQKISYPLPREQILEVYPGYFPERRVLRVRKECPTGSKVLKIRPDDQAGATEVYKLQCLLACERFMGAHNCGVEVTHIQRSAYMIIHMPYLGVDITRLSKDLDLLELGYLEEEEVLFRGFTSGQIRRLVDQLRNGHRAFSDKYGLVHGDLFQQRSPNNIVYDSSLERLFLVDAEALAEVTEESTDRFCDQLDKVQEWMCTSLMAV